MSNIYKKKYGSHKLVSSKTVAKYIKPELFEMKGEIAKNKIIVGTLIFLFQN